jgi:hypothetical protein
MNSQGENKETVRISRKTGKPVTTWGGRREGGGRKKRMEEEEIIAKLEPMAEAAFNALKEKILEKDMKAIQLFCQYFIGLPTQKIENKIEGQLNQVNVEVVRPQLKPVDELTN